VTVELLQLLGPTRTLTTSIVLCVSVGMVMANLLAFSRQASTRRKRRIVLIVIGLVCGVVVFLGLLFGEGLLRLPPAAQRFLQRTFPPRMDFSFLEAWSNGLNYLSLHRRPALL